MVTDETREMERLAVIERAVTGCNEILSLKIPEGIVSVMARSIWLALHENERLMQPMSAPTLPEGNPEDG